MLIEKREVRWKEGLKDYMDMEVLKTYLVYISIFNINLYIFYHFIKWLCSLGKQCTLNSIASELLV